MIVRIRTSQLGLALACLLTLTPLPLTAQDEPTTPELVAHYARVERELRARDTSDLSIEQRSARARVIDLLHAYRTRADFGELRPGDGVRVPYFIDDQGRRCAVGNLLDATGNGATALRIATQANHAWICELAADLELQSWLTTQGLSLAEAARIQGPSRGLRPDLVRQAPVNEGGRGGTERVITRSAPRPAGTNLTGNGPSGMATAGARSGLTPGLRGGALEVTYPEDWSTWWHFNRNAFVTAESDATLARRVPNETFALDYLTRVRGELAPLFLRGIADANASVRAASATALGRVSGATAVAPLVGLLADPSLEVRHAAILALGRTGSLRAAHALAWLANFGQQPATQAVTTPLAQPLALLALGMLRRSDPHGVCDQLVTDLFARGAASRSTDTSFAAMCYREVAQSAVLHGEVVAMAESERNGLLRCRALESLGANGDAGAMGTLMRALGGRNLAARRSAALALARVPNDLATPGLLTAFELEKEQLTRGFLLLAIGERADPLGRAFLLEVLKEGSKSLRSFCALGLGLHARARPDPEVKQELRKLFPAELNHAASGAYLVASGLARDVDAEPVLVAALREQKSSIARTSAAEALALLGTPGARAALRAQMPVDTCPYVRIAIGEALSCFHVQEDSKLVLSLLADSYDAETDERTVDAVARMRSAVVVQALREMLASTSTPGPQRALATRALGRLLGHPAAPNLADLAAGANCFMLPYWLHDVLLAGV